MFDKPRLKNYLEDRVGKSGYSGFSIRSGKLPLIAYSVVLVFNRKLIEGAIFGLVRDYFGNLSYKEVKIYRFGAIFERKNLNSVDMVFVETKNDENILSLVASYNRVYL
ncbi:hypothetical protein HYU23_01485 [Candidatus Woesearchaeota archaeon]|nr:hypothetical protein [Candidatus Woesearchaeota archaeon]